MVRQISPTELQLDKTKDLGQSPIQSAQVLTACGQDDAYLTTIFLCLNQTLTFSVPSKKRYFENIA